MIKAILISSGDEPTLILGITKFNIKKMREGNPIYIDLGKLGWRLERCEENPEKTSKILIMYGRTEKEIGAKLGMSLEDPKPGQETIVKVDPQPDHGGG